MTKFVTDAQNILRNMKRIVLVMPHKVETYTTDTGRIFVRNDSGIIGADFEGDEISDERAVAMIAERMETHCA